MSDLHSQAMNLKSRVDKDMRSIQRVSIVTETFYPEINGVANTLKFLLDGLIKKGLSVQIIRPKQHALDSPKDDGNVQVVTIPGLPIPGYKQLKFGLPFRRKISRALNQFNSEALYIATEGPLGIAALIAAKKSNIPVLSGFHTNFHQYFEHYHLAFLKRLVFRYLRAFHNATARTLVPTNCLMKELSAQGFRQVQVMSRGIDSELFSPVKRSLQLRSNWGVGSDDPVVLYVGRIAQEKNILLAMQSFDTFKRLQPNGKMVLVGDGPMRKALELAYPEAIFAGELRGELLAQYYASADIFLFPSLTDTFGNVVLEAMASGLHVLGFDYAAPGTLIQKGFNGSLAKLGNESDFIEKLEYIALSWKTNSLIREHARETSKNLSWDVISEQFLKQFQMIKEELSDGSRQKSISIPKV